MKFKKWLACFQTGSALNRPLQMSAWMFFGPGLSLHATQGEDMLRVRGGQLSLLAYLSSAIHIKVIESLDSSSFINKLRTIQAIQGPVKPHMGTRV